MAQTSRRSALLFVFAILTGTAQTSLAEAADADCANLKAQLARLDRSQAFQSPEYRTWQDALDRQTAAIVAAEKDALDLNCGVDHSASCENLSAKISRMQKNLATLTGQRDRFSGTGVEANEQRQAIVERLKKADCSTPSRRTSAPLGLKKSQGTFSSISTSGTPPSRERYSISSRSVEIEASQSSTEYIEEETSELNDGLVSARFGEGAYRTLCVRTCDGFYFPVSFSTHKYGFARDEAICRSMCPATETSLYVHRNPGETIKNLVSLEGTPYRKMPNAFLFRTRFVENCSCQNDPGSEQAISSLIRSSDVDAGQYSGDHAGSPDRVAAPHTGPTIAPAAIVPDGADPDTEMNIRLGYTPDEGRPAIPTLGKSEQPEADSTAPVVPPAVTTEKREIRIVGPKYFVAQ